jgi:paraquat-inducible protein A
MKLENEDALDDLIICHQCHTLHEEIPIADGSKALCSECGTVLYRYDSKLIDHGLALSITALIFFAVANLFPIVKIELLGHEQFITIPKTFMTLIDQGFYIVGLLCAFLIFLFPLMVFSLYTAIFILFRLKKGRQLTKELLVLLSYALKWNMSDIFLISILVALVKLIGYAQIHMGVAFWALIVYVVIDIYLTRQIHLSEMWMLRKRIYGEER